MLNNSFKESQEDHNLFTYECESNFIASLLYVDDLIIADNNSIAYIKFKQYISNHFHIKDLRDSKYYLGLELTRGSTGLFIFQIIYTLDILNECDRLSCKPFSFSMEQNQKMALVNITYFLEPSRYLTLMAMLRLPHYYHIRDNISNSYSKSIYANLSSRSLGCNHESLEMPGIFSKSRHKPTKGLIKNLLVIVTKIDFMSYY